MRSALILALATGCVAEVGDLEPRPPESTQPARDCATCDDIAASLDGLRWELPCAPPPDPGNGVCYCDQHKQIRTTLEGPADTLYDVELRFRGVAEMREYTGGVDAAPFYYEGTYDTDDPWNVYSLTVSEPPDRLFLNAGTTGLYHVREIDAVVTIVARGGATLTLDARSLDEKQIENIDASGRPIVIPEIWPAPNAFDGQFIEMTVVSVRSR